MSYDIDLLDPVTKEIIKLDFKHQMRSGTYVFGGTTEASLNITWNYSEFFSKTLEEDGVRTIYGMTCAESIPILQEAADQLKDNIDEDYWKATEGNTKQALKQLIVLAHLRPDGIWNGD